MVDSSALLEQCAPQVSAQLMHALVHVESAWRPFAIGMDAGERPIRQPQTKAQAVAQARALVAAGRRFSVGLAQIHMSNVARFGMSWEQAFDPCLNLGAGQRVLQGFYRDAQTAGYLGLSATQAALRGYNAGDIDRESSARYATRVIAYSQGALAAVHSSAQEVASDALSQTAAVPLRATRRGHAVPAALSRSEAADIFSRTLTVPGF